MPRKKVIFTKQSQSDPISAQQSASRDEHRQLPRQGSNSRTPTKRRNYPHHIAELSGVVVYHFRESHQTETWLTKLNQSLDMNRVRL